MLTGLCGGGGVHGAGEEFFITAFWVTVLWTMFVVIGAETVKEEAPYST